MPCIVQLTASTSIYVYANDHMPPHFHILTPDGDALVDMQTLQIIRGMVRRRPYALTVAWASEPANRDRLHAEWRRLNEGDD